MRGIVFLMVLGLSACVAADATAPASASNEVRDWQEASGRPPSRAELVAVVAACQDRAAVKANRGALDGCLADLGLRRVQ